MLANDALIPSSDVLQTQGFVIWFAAIFAAVMIVFVGLFVRHMLARDDAMLAREDSHRLSLEELNKSHQQAILALANSNASLVVKTTNVMNDIVIGLKELGSALDKSTETVRDLVRQAS